jgi:hypothetical protein
VREHDEVHCRQRIPCEAKLLAHDTLDAIAVDGAGECLSGDGEPDARVLQ